MVSIKDITGHFWVPCPKCGYGVVIEEWGEQTCRYQKCDGHKFTFEYNFQNVELLLKELQRLADLAKIIKPLSMRRPSMPRLQKVLDGWIAVPQRDTEDPRKWYHADQVLFKDYVAEYLAEKE
jgi:hypothetical protein